MHEAWNKSVIFNCVCLNSLFTCVPETSRLYPLVISTQPRYCSDMSSEVREQYVDLFDLFTALDTQALSHVFSISCWRISERVSSF